ncbi:hypothetical protein BGZ70_008056 [Mortierella alpina]|uniref:Uncharacterized protein n=1 Tax=Mortierella alpina TaxID=64518 RepID=A0A9P6J4E1_MORAP|nr:hypothetical protein BGZ70_008056 [Mortierella alpina]
MDEPIPQQPSENEAPSLSPTTAPVLPSATPHLDTTTVSTPSWLLWQFLDSALPTGGFIASNGLEAFAKLHPDSTSPRDVEAYVNYSVHACGYTNLPFINAVWTLVDTWTLRDRELKTERGKRRAMESVLHRIGNIDREYDVFMNNAIQNAASRKQGDGIVMMGVKCFADQLKTPSHRSQSRTTPGWGSRYEEEDAEEEEKKEGEEDENDNELGPNIRILKPFKTLIRSEEIAGHYPIAFAMIARDDTIFTFASTCSDIIVVCYPPRAGRTLSSTTHYDSIPS